MAKYTLGTAERDYTLFRAWDIDTRKPDGVETLDVYCSEAGQLDVVLGGAETTPDSYRVVRLIGDPSNIKINVLDLYSRIENIKPVCIFEPSGCSIRRGFIKLRWDFYLPPEDDRYSECLVNVPIMPDEPYTGTEEDYAVWYKSLPTKQVLAPFHSHLFYCDPTNTKEQILEVAEIISFEAYDLWLKKESVRTFNPPLPNMKMTEDRLTICVNRLINIASVPWPQ